MTRPLNVMSHAMAHLLKRLALRAELAAARTNGNPRWIAEVVREVDMLERTRR